MATYEYRVRMNTQTSPGNADDGIFVEAPEREVLRDEGGVYNRVRVRVWSKDSAIDFAEKGDPATSDPRSEGCCITVERRTVSRNPNETWAVLRVYVMRSGVACCTYPTAAPARASSVVGPLDLDAIRTRHAAVKTLRAAERSAADVPVLLAEVERVRRLAREALRADTDEVQTMIDALREIVGGEPKCRR